MTERGRDGGAGAPPDDPIRVFAVRTGKGAPITDDDPAAWLLGESRSVEDDAAFFDDLCWRIVGNGVPLWRATLHVAILHPQLLAFGCRWWRERNVTEELAVPLDIEQSPEFLGSPIRPAVLDGEALRYRLREAEGESFALFRRLREEGASDYLCLPLFRAADRHPIVTWTTDAPEGFSDEQVGRLRALTPALAAVVETRAVRRAAATLLDTYLGRVAGPRILAGQIRRGQGERLQAVILAADLRGFTEFSDRLPAEAVIRLLDDYFECVTAAVQGHGGEVLKFIGDGVLSIFPVKGLGDRAAATAALDAAAEALAALDAPGRATGESGPPLRAGFGLHIGEVVYGNVGAPDRLDFTVIGPAVNLAFRLEGLTKELGRPLLASAAFAHAAPRRLVSLGFRVMRGIEKPQEVFGLNEHEPALPTGLVAGLTEAADWPQPRLPSRGGTNSLEVTEEDLVESEIVRV